MARGFDHLHLRKRIHQKHEKFPHPNKWKRFMDKFIYFIAIFGPLIAIPQVLKIWYNQNSSGVSILTWSGYLLGGIFWLIYGLMHKEKPIVITNSLWIIVEIFIIIGIFRFG